LADAERERIVAKLASNAANAPVDEKDYFRAFVQDIGLPNAWYAEIAGVWNGNAQADAVTLVRWAYGKGWFPRDNEKRNQSVIGAILWRLAEDDVGPDGNEFVRVILKYKLILDQAIMVELRRRLEHAGDGD